jgi:hypothetical protein
MTPQSRFLVLFDVVRDYAITFQLKTVDKSMQKIITNTVCIYFHRKISVKIMNLYVAILEIIIYLLLQKSPVNRVILLIMKGT